MDEMIVSVHSSHMDLLVTGIVCCSSCSTDNIFPGGPHSIRRDGKNFLGWGFELCTSKNTLNSEVPIVRTNKGPVNLYLAALYGWHRDSRQKM
jgi:hypothetical protein